MTILSPSKFKDRLITAKGEKRAFVPMESMETLWFNTGTLCNLKCANCYIESSPTNDRLVYLEQSDVIPFLEEVKLNKNNKIKVQRIGFTGGEPFINPHMFEILEETFKRSLGALVLTNAYKVILRSEKKFLDLKEKYNDLLSLRVSLDHYTSEVHENERGIGTFEPTMKAIKWLYDQGFHLSIAGRSLTSESMDEARQGYQNLLNESGIDLNLTSSNLVIFPEMDAMEDVPEITVDCWGILKKTPAMQMCSSERMIVKKKGSEKAQVQACTLLAYDEEFNMGSTLEESFKPVYLNHPFCAKFCVLGGASCSSTE
ncbi:MAG: sulfatase maturation enzyme AslB (radical SAM superfamily) [Bacteriovoracaceae bacterium]|jgi:sulfatase maturation enzyme AslB (radical SAM superfamily)